MVPSGSPSTTSQQSREVGSVDLGSFWKFVNVDP